MALKFQQAVTRMPNATSSPKKTVTLVLMDPPYESANSTSAFRLIEALLVKKHVVNVFAYEGATALSVDSQKTHANTVVKGVSEEKPHILTKDWITSLFHLAEQHETRLTWINCGICMDERGIDTMVKEVRRGDPSHMTEFMETSDITLIIPTRHNG